MMKTRTGRWRLTIAAMTGLVLLTGVIHVAHALTLDRIIEYKEVTFRSEKIGPLLSGYRVAFVTDTHAIPADELRVAVEEINARDPDTLLLGGDFPVRDAAWRSMEILSGVEAPDGIYGVEGNHDSWENLSAAMAAHGVVPLDNTGLHLRENLYLAGVQDLWNRSPDVAKALADATADDFVLLLCHNPDLSMEQDMAGVELMLSGHTHGGQITLFGVFAPELALRKTITGYGQRFQSGWAESSDGTAVYVSNGAGQLQGVPRVFARPQVILLTLEGAAESS